MAINKKQVFVNGKVFTGRSEEEFVSAFRVANGKVIWIGDRREAKSKNAVDLEGKTVLSRFIDVHTHPTYVAMIVNSVPCTVPVVNNIPEMVGALKRHPNFGKGAKDWIEGFGYDESKLVEHRTPTAEDLDKVSTTQPVYVLRSDCHSGICNSRALQIAGITKDTPDPQGAHRKQLDALAETLMERETLDEQEILGATGLSPAPPSETGKLPVPGADSKGTGPLS